jgi:FKBP-type peptidyl-prolyl cis-trans isomerase 2
VIVLVVVGIVSALGYSWYTDSQKEPEKETKKDLFVREGDLITCDFTEYIWSRDSTGTLTYSVYQTTLTNVASDESIPKSVTFQRILTNNTGGSIARDRLTAIVGNDLTTEMNEGFNQLVLDMEVDETKTKELSSKLGYGERNESLVQSIPLLDKMPIYERISRADFEAEYPEEVPLEPGKSFKHHYWGWYIRIDSVNAEEVVIKHEPEIGQDIEIFSWPSSVENVSSKSGLIWIRHRPAQDIINTPIDAEALEYYNPVFTEIKQNIVETQQPYPGIILSIQNGIEIDFNRENIGKNLKYEITIIKIERD